MSTVQIAGIAVALVILVALVVSLIITRRKDKAITESAAVVPESGASIFDEAPRDQFDKLGKKDIAAGGLGRAAVDEPVVEAAEPAQPAVFAPAAATAATEPAFDAAATADLRVRIEATRHAVAEALDRPFIAEPGEARHAAAAAGAGAAFSPDGAAGVPAGRATAGPVDLEDEVQTADLPRLPAAAPAPAAAATPASVPLSQVLTSSSEQLIDLSDADVRRMLKELVKNEVDLATQYRGLGRFAEAVAPLVEAEKVCTALGLTSQAALVRAMIADLRRSAGRGA